MNEKLFSYGTLQLESVQREHFGCTLKGHADVLPGFEIRDCLISDSNVVSTSGKSIHPIACFTGDAQDGVTGMVFEISSQELEEADKYEVDDYKRIKRTLKSGEQAWVYVQSGLNIDLKYLHNGSIKLELFQEHHIPKLIETAQDARIWRHHGLALEDPKIFKTFGIDKAQEDIANKTRYMFVIQHQDQIIGSSSYYDVDLRHLSMYIGYTWFHPDYWGKGINPLVKKLMLRYAFEQLKFRRVAFCIDSENQQSRRALEKLNIPLEGILKNHQIRPNLTTRHSAIYAVNNEQWILSHENI